MLPFFQNKQIGIAPILHMTKAAFCQLKTWMGPYQPTPKYVAIEL